MTAYRSRNSNKGNVWVFLLVIACILGGLFFTGLIPKLMEKRELANRAEQLGSEVPVVQTVLVTPAPFEESASLPGNIGAMQYATIYARVDGYLKSRIV